MTEIDTVQHNPFPNRMETNAKVQLRQNPRRSSPVVESHFARPVALRLKGNPQD
jgi:hypothetical protein